MKLIDISEELDVKIEWDGVEYSLMAYETNVNDSYEANSSCREWCALQEKCSQAIPPRKFCEPFNSCIPRYYNKLLFQV